MSKQLKLIFTDDVVKHLKENKDQITSELLAQMRSFGNAGKNLAIEILGTGRDQEQYYLDAFNNRITYDGNRQLKKAFTKMALSPIHIEELKKCADDLHYFKDNYIKIRTKSGVNFPDMRKYQNDFLDIILPDENENVISLQPRQAGKTISVSVYLTHKFIFSTEMNIGICANRAPMAREFLNNVKNILIELPIWMQQGLVVWNKGNIENENGMRILTDATSSNSFRGFSCAIVVIDETAFISPSIWDEFADSIFPAQSGLAWKKNIMISTANGMNHFYQMVEGAKKDENDMTFFEVNWKDVPRFKPDGSVFESEEFKDSVVRKHGMVYFEQNYGNNFLGSSYTLISTEKMKEMTPKEPEMIRDNKLNIYEYPQKGHNYFMMVDPAKDGKDAFAVQILDVTTLNFKQVASAQLDIEYLKMPAYLMEWCELYNNPHLIIENNEGAGQSIADQIHRDYEYENLYFDLENAKSRKRKKYPGFRTTRGNRSQLLNTLKLFIENGMLEIVDKATIDEFYSFILTKNKYQADDGAHDDMIMALAIGFAPFLSTRNFDDMGALIEKMYSDDIQSDVSFTSTLTIGSFDDFTDEEMGNDVDSSYGEEYEKHLSVGFDEYDGFSRYNEQYDGFN